MDQLVPCRACNVHVRVGDKQCPFCGVTTSGALESGPRARTSRATLHRLHAAAMATCALACDGPSTNAVTIAPTGTATASATTTTTATATATATATTARSGEGASCKSDGDCTTGLNCCETGLSGKCGGAQPPPNVRVEPCVILRTCTAQPCTPMSMPPYGGAFPESLTV